MEAKQDALLHCSFDVYNLAYGEVPDGLDFSGSDDEGGSGCNGGPTSINSPTTSHRAVRVRPSASPVPAPASPPSPAAAHPAAPAQSNVTCYRFGSVGQDTLICLWDLTEDCLKMSAASQRGRAAAARAGAGRTGSGGGMSHSNSVTSKDSGLAATDTSSSNHSSGGSSAGSTDTGKASSTSSLTHKVRRSL